jgi:hypothetical protein
VRVQLRHRRIAQHDIAIARPPDRHPLRIRIARRLHDRQHLDVGDRPRPRLHRASRRDRIEHLCRETDQIVILDLVGEHQKEIFDLGDELIACREARQNHDAVGIHRPVA